MKNYESYPSVLNVEDIQKILGIGRGQAYQLAHSGQFHVVRLGNRIKIAKEVFIQWLTGIQDNKKGAYSNEQ